MNLKVTITFIATEDDWNISDLLQDCNGDIHTDEAIDIIKTALLDDAKYVIQNASISIKQDHDSL